MPTDSPSDPPAAVRPSEPIDRGMVARIRRLLLTPIDEWVAIDAEPMTERQIISGWVMPLAAIGPAATLIGSVVFGYGSFGIIYRPSIAMAVLLAAISYCLAIIGVWVLAKIIDALAPTFDGAKDPVAAMKVAAYSSTAAWLAGAFGILPSIAFLSIVGIYSLYLLYVGLPLLMKVPTEKSVGYVVATIVAAVVVFMVVGEITGSIAARMVATAVFGYSVT